MTTTLMTNGKLTQTWSLEKKSYSVDLFARDGALQPSGVTLNCHFSPVVPLEATKKDVSEG